MYRSENMVNIAGLFALFFAIVKMVACPQILWSGWASQAHCVWRYLAASFRHHGVRGNRVLDRLEHSHCGEGQQIHRLWTGGARQHHPQTVRHSRVPSLPPAHRWARDSVTRAGCSRRRQIHISSFKRPLRHLRVSANIYTVRHNAASLCSPVFSQRQERLNSLSLL